MNILITGANGFAGKNLTEALKAVRDGKDHTHRIGKIEHPSDLKIFTYDVQNTMDELDVACRDCDFVFHLAGVNRPQHSDAFMQGNYGFSATLLSKLKKYDNRCPIVVSSSIQATLIGRYDNEYGRSKKAGEELFFDYAKETGAKVLVYRFPNLFGKWCRPNYNSAVATFCHNIANDLPITVNDRNTSLTLLYIDDFIEEMFDALCGREHRCTFDGTEPVFDKNGAYCACPVTHRATLGEIVDLLETFRAQSSRKFRLTALQKNCILLIFPIYPRKKFGLRSICTKMKEEALPSC